MEKVLQKASTISRKKSIKTDQPPAPNSHMASAPSSPSVPTSSNGSVNNPNGSHDYKHSSPKSSQPPASHRSSLLLSSSRLSRSSRQSSSGTLSSNHSSHSLHHHLHHPHHHYHTYPRHDKAANKETYKQQDKYIKSLLKQYKRLEVDLTKFNSKHNGVLKTNILRTTLLPFLRSPRTLETIFPSDSRTYRSLISISTTNLLKWWKSLLSTLTAKNASATVSATDRNAYLECISRILARPEWEFIDHEIFSSYQSLLTSTLDFAIMKLQTLKIVPLSISAFVGKVFAYSYFHLPHVSNALLFLLNVKQAAFESCQLDFNFVSNKNSKIEQQTAQLLRARFPPSVHYLINFNGLSNIPKDRKMFINCMPAPKHPVAGIKDPNGSWVRRWCNIDSDVFNSFFRHYITISQNRLASSLENGGFTSEHTSTTGLSSNPATFEPLPTTFESSSSPSPSPSPSASASPSSPSSSSTTTAASALSPAMLFYSCPGFNVLLSHVSQVFGVSITRILKNNAYTKAAGPNMPFMLDPKPPAPMHKQQSQQQSQSAQQSQHSKQGQPKTTSVPVNAHLKQNDVYYNSIIKILKTVRDVNFSNSLFSSDLIRFTDTILISIAKSTSVHDYTKSGLVLNIFYEFINHVFDASSVEWEFWLGCTYMMMNNTDHIQTLLKNLAFLFNVWDMIPQTLSMVENPASYPYLKGWLVNSGNSFKLNFIDWLISNPVWSKFFSHWHPVVRSYYIKLVIWRVIGINNMESSTAIQITKRIESKLRLSFENLTQYTQSQKIQSRQFGGYKPPMDFTPDSPLVNRKFGILPTNLKTEFLMINDQSPEVTPATLGKPSELRKSHSFEIFDEAIYSCSSLPSGPSPNNFSNNGGSSGGVSGGKQQTSETDGNVESTSTSSSRNNSLVSSIGKLFKMLSSDDSVSNSTGNDNTGAKSNCTPPPKNEGISSLANKSLSKSNDDMTKLYPPQKGGFSLKNKRNSVSLTSLSTAYSRSSSPSIMSYQSTPTSFTDFSSDSSVRSDSDSSSTKSDSLDQWNGGSKPNSPNSETANQPPELFKIPPEIVRPLYKFELIVDHERMNNKFSMMQYTNSSSKKFYSSTSAYGSNSSLQLPLRSSHAHSLPSKPKVPSVTIFVNADSYNRFYISTENIILATDQFSEPDFEEVEGFLKELNANYKRSVQWNNLGKSLNEWNLAVDEFEKYLVHKVEMDEFNYMQSGPIDQAKENIDESEYFRRIIPFLPVDSTNEFKLLNAG